MTGCRPQEADLPTLEHLSFWTDVSPLWWFCCPLFCYRQAVVPSVETSEYQSPNNIMFICPSKPSGTSVPKYVTHRRTFLERQHVGMSAVEFKCVYHL